MKFAVKKKFERAQRYKTAREYGSESLLARLLKAAGVK